MREQKKRQKNSTMQRLERSLLSQRLLLVKRRGVRDPAGESKLKRATLRMWCNLNAVEGSRSSVRVEWFSDSPLL
jgi:hypothetical protein